MSARVHELKTWPTYWDAIKRGEKTYEVRRNDRFYQTGDIVELHRMSEDGTSMLNGRCVPFAENTLRFRIGALLPGGLFGIEPGFVVFSLLPDEAQG